MPALHSSCSIFPCPPTPCPQNPQIVIDLSKETSGKGVLNQNIPLIPPRLLSATEIPQLRQKHKTRQNKTEKGRTERREIETRQMKSRRKKKTNNKTQTNWRTALTKLQVGGGGCVCVKNLASAAFCDMSLREINTISQALQETIAMCAGGGSLCFPRHPLLLLSALKLPLN